ncbi:hypothetical protein ABT368_10880 [Streptomyces althioticus]|jgi:hypothetical protein|uniref:hypothetical protein n=1 Tax=Actinomycetes TaxID=1760 RepID=UPI00073A8DC8|nr:MULTISPECIES: hypothetical protein [Actinomycetes]ALV50978.1 hypothetical protein ASR50_17165 [Streptomyces sp. 4F]MBM4829879.1 hypothetical protein [Actinospica acidiphila]GGT57729.1 hypothetical protein GCM10010243_40460 [Streptomyces matensis]
MSAPYPRTTRAGRGLRILRAAVFAAVCVVLAGAGHSLASCDAVPLWTLGAGFLAAVAVAVPLAGRTRPLPVITALLAGGQTALHTLFGLGQHGAGASDASLVAQAARLWCGPGTISPAQAERLLADARILPHGPGAHEADAVAGPVGSLLPSLPMLLGHVLAATVAGWLLRRGDLALLRLAELSAQGVAEGALVRSLRGALALVRALRAGLPGAPEAGPVTPRTALLPPLPPRSAGLHHTVIRRGPPASVSALALAA